MYIYIRICIYLIYKLFKERYKRLLFYIYIYIYTYVIYVYLCIVCNHEITRIMEFPEKHFSILGSTEN